MITVLKKMVFILSFVMVDLFYSCDNIGRHAKIAWDEGPVEKIRHNGTFKGYVSVYTINWIDETQTESNERYRVYQKEDGDYVIDYEGDVYVLQEASEPVKVGIHALKWKLDYNHYIIDVPQSY